MYSVYSEKDLVLMHWKPRAMTHLLIRIKFLCVGTLLLDYFWQIKVRVYQLLSRYLSEKTIINLQYAQASPNL